MSPRPAIPYTAAEQIDELKRMAPELVTRRHQLPDAETVRALQAIHRHLEEIAAEEGVQLRITEVPDVRKLNRLEYDLAKERDRHSTLQWNVTRGLIYAFVPLAACATVAIHHGEWFLALVTGTMTLAALPLIVMSHQAECREVR